MTALPIDSTPVDLAQIDLVLASSSSYRRALLERLTPRVRQLAPDCDESARPGEGAAELAGRLATLKARAIAAKCGPAVVIGSDQTADLNGAILGKPGDLDRATAQLVAASGKSVVFHTAFFLIDSRAGTPRKLTTMDTTLVVFRRLGEPELRRYLARERPFDCAGSFKAEALGIALFDHIESTDPTALIGLPLIAVCRLLRECGIAVI